MKNLQANFKIYRISFDNDKGIVSLFSTVLVLHLQKNRARGQVLSNGPRLTTRDPKKVWLLLQQTYFKLS